MLQPGTTSYSNVRNGPSGSGPAAVDPSGGGGLAAEDIVTNVL